MKSNNYFQRRLLPAVAFSLLCGVALAAQTNSLNSLSAVVNYTAPEKVIGKANTAVTVDVVVQVKNGYHVNSNAPDDPYLIPLKITWAEDVGKVQGTTFPKPKMESFPFSQKPLSVYEGDIRTQTRFLIPATAKPGLVHLTGKLRYQACSDKACLPPRTLDIKIPLEIRN